ncbi:MAG: hypothetical protein A2Z49_10320 [Chloroflexi bacterium RBG_19FT_COMBO_56_12]|nr:MAG: hypothetical protein A2Z49_10320 [Chloroflexi bacterium RBG_19FT_COMBO_56_12]
MGYTTITPGGTTLILPISPNLTALYLTHINPWIGIDTCMPAQTRSNIKIHLDTVLTAELVKGIANLVDQHHLEPAEILRHHPTFQLLRLNPQLLHY